MVKCFKKLKTANMCAQYVPNFKNIMIKGERERQGKSKHEQAQEKIGKTLCKMSVIIAQMVCQ